MGNEYYLKNIQFEYHYMNAKKWPISTCYIILEQQIKSKVGDLKKTSCLGVSFSVFLF